MDVRCWIEPERRAPDEAVSNRNAVAEKPKNRGTAPRAADGVAAGSGGEDWRCRCHSGEVARGEQEAADKFLGRVKLLLGDSDARRENIRRAG